ncbi:MAG: tetratricopeptide repeat protein [Gemmatimonadota bacterium]|nr:MAG: tetratricopeptide repeat protein [Gemmatimonadota bacterium]
MFNDISPGCTFVIKTHGETVIVDYNEDSIEPRTKIWFYTPSDESYGYVIWGYDRYSYRSQGGMNDQGLFIDINSVGFTGWVNDPEKPDFEGDDEIEYILTHFATVDEVVEFFQQYDIDLSYAIFIVADAQGKSVIFEWGKGRLQTLFKKKDYQIATNFVQTEFDSPEEYTDQRYRIARQILQSQKAPTIDLIRRVLSATRFEAYYCRTLYSIICDLRNRQIYLYHFHNFEEVVVYNLLKELEKGSRSYAIPSLFGVRSFSERFSDQYGSEYGARDLIKIIEEKGIDEGIKRFWEMKEETRTIHRYVFDEWLVKSVGLSFLSRNRTEEALEIFKLNSQLYPESCDVYYNLAEAYMKNGDKPMAMENYRKALERNPDERNIQRILNKLKHEKD